MKTKYDDIPINWSKISEILTGNKFTIRRTFVPKKYQAIIEQLRTYINDILGGLK